MFNSRSPTQPGPTAGTLPPSSTPPPPDDPLPKHLREHVHRLRLILPVISVSVMALHRQNAELDHDIATILDHYASEPLDDEIEHLESLLASHACRRRAEVVCT